MRLFFSALTIGLIVASPVVAGGEPLVGHWKFSIFERDQQISFWLLHFEKGKDGKPVATADPLSGAPKVKIEDVKQVGDSITIKFEATVVGKGGPQKIEFDFEGKLPKAGAKFVYGSLSQGAALVPAVLESTTAKTPFDLDREQIQRAPGEPKSMTVIFEVISNAKENKIEPKELQIWVDNSMKGAETYGPRFQMKHQMRLLGALQEQKMYAAVGIETARKLSKQIEPGTPLETQLQLFAMLTEFFRDSELKDEAKKFASATAPKLGAQIDEKTPLDTQLKVLSQVTQILKANDLKEEAKKFAGATSAKIGRQVDDKMPLISQLQNLSALTAVLRSNDLKAEASEYETRIEKLEGPAYTAYAKDALNFKTEKFTGRKIKSNRTVLVELFTGAQCPPCVAVDMAFDGLEKTYGPNDVVLLQYHMHIPRPEPMANADAEARFEFYRETYPKQVRGMPSTLFNGKPEVGGGGYLEDAPDKFKEFTGVVNKLLESPATFTLSASAIRTGEKIAITAKVQGLEKPGDKLRLRLALVEDWVRYKGSNGVQYHHRVVRALPGGVKGVSIKGKDFDHQASVDLDELRKGLNKYLNEDYPEGPRPMRLRHLSVVAFVQNDESTEVLQAVNAPVRQEK